MLAICADHGNDPTTPSTDHSRECVPLLVVFGGGTGSGVWLGRRSSFADLGASVADFLNIKWSLEGQSFMNTAMRG
ncbi:MAG: Phosphopentomutase [Firmicutes bacterium ADurb.Bin506]|nr:MAG: Phosphopentomutase [Firmicutes bacterium ADurb.Bin506]